MKESILFALIVDVMVIIMMLTLWILALKVEMIMVVACMGIENLFPLVEIDQVVFLGEIWREMGG